MSDEKKSTTTTTKSDAGKSPAKNDQSKVDASAEFAEALERGYFGELPKGASDGK